MIKISTVDGTAGRLVVTDKIRLPKVTHLKFEGHVTDAKRGGIGLLKICPVEM